MKDDGLEDHHCLTIPAKFNSKKDMAQDLLLLFTNRVEVKFVSGHKIKTLEGWWCNPCQ